MASSSSVVWLCWVGLEALEEWNRQRKFWKLEPHVKRIESSIAQNYFALHFIGTKHTTRWLRKVPNLCLHQWQIQQAPWSSWIPWCLESSNKNDKSKSMKGEGSPGSHLKHLLIHACWDFELYKGTYNPTLQCMHLRGWRAKIVCQLLEWRLKV